jgi:hypothetical protein
MPVHPSADEVPDLPICPGIGCGLPFIPNETTWSGFCPACQGLYLFGAERERHTGAVPPCDQGDPGPQPGGRVCGACRRWVRMDSAVCGGCVDLVEFGRDLVGELAAVDL